MATLRIALAQVNPTVGDLLGNRALVVESTAKAAAAGADLVAFPEMMLSGYPIEDLALRPSFQFACARSLQTLAADLDAAGLGATAVVVGHLAPMPADAQDRRGYNAAAVLHGGTIVADYAKHHLPNYGVFDEQRYFRSSDQPCRIRVGGVDVALAICEDIWVSAGPLTQLREQPPGVLLVINGSPYERNKDDVRLQLCSERARQVGCTLAYVNMWGGQDELVFDGDSMVVDAAGDVLARAPVRGSPAGGRSGRPRSHHRAHGGATGRTPGAAGHPARRRATQRRPGGLPGAGDGVARLRAQERLPQRGSGHVGRDRLGIGRRHRLRRGRSGERLRGPDAQRVLVGAFACRRRGVRGPHRHEPAHDPDHRHGRCLSDAI